MSVFSRTILPSHFCGKLWETGQKQIDAKIKQNIKRGMR